MTATEVDAKVRQRVAELAAKVLDGELLTREEAAWLFELDPAGSIHDVLYWANQIRTRYKGNNIRLCSIVNIKAGGCPEDCKFCAQSAHSKAPSPRYGVIDNVTLKKAADQARTNNVRALGLVAAWPEVKEGPVLDELCEKFRLLSLEYGVEPHASLGMIKNRKIAEKLKAAGVTCYNHNLETAPSFFPRICTTHTYADRVETIRHLKAAGIAVCAGGIIGLGETRRDRCELALALRELGADVVPINILNPIPGTPLEGTAPPTPIEALHTIACFRFVLPDREITIAGGRAVNLRDLQSWIFMAGASGLMVGNYLTTPNRPVELDLQMIRDAGLSPV
ncbi:MAG: biotin synthase BioB [Verrucomicrobiae bacterium]|nr:biotin synthase BioB [Verrucomicrobiae bacterium]